MSQWKDEWMEYRQKKEKFQRLKTLNLFRKHMKVRTYLPSKWQEEGIHKDSKTYMFPKRFNVDLMK